MGFAHRAFVAAGVGFVAAAVVGCGSSGGSWLSASQSSTLTEQLNRVTQALDDGQCQLAQRYLADFQSSVDNMGGVNSTLIGNLDQGASTIQSLSNQECRTVTTVPKKTHPKTTTTTTPTQTQTQTFTNPATQTYTTPTYTQPLYSPPSTSTSGGAAPTVPTTTTNTTPPPTAPSSGGGGLGSGTDTTVTGSDTTTSSGVTTTAGTTTTDTTGDTVSGF